MIKTLIVMLSCLNMSLGVLLVKYGGKSANGVRYPTFDLGKGSKQKVYTKNCIGIEGNGKWYLIRSALKYSSVTDRVQVEPPIIKIVVNSGGSKVTKTFEASAFGENKNKGCVPDDTDPSNVVSVDLADNKLAWLISNEMTGE